MAHRPYFAIVCLVLVALFTPANAMPLAGVTYDYNPALLPNPDDGNGEWTWNFAGKDLTQTKLADGVLGTLDILPGETVAFSNGTWAGYFAGDGGVGHPRVDLDLGGTYQVKSVEVQYLIEASPFIFAPQPVDFESDGMVDANAMSIFGSTAGIDYNPIGASNAFEPIFGPAGSIALGTRAARTAVFEFGPAGVTASHLRVDIRTPFNWIFLGEITVNQVPEPAALGLLSSGLLGLLFVERRREA